MEFDKEFKELPDLVHGLFENGLSADSPEQALNFMKTVGYHRSGGYRYIFRELLPREKQDYRTRSWRSDKYIPGANFQDLIKVCDFDKKLREVCFKGTLEFESRLKHEMSHVLARRNIYSHTEEKHLDQAECQKIDDPENNLSKFDMWVKSHEKACKDAKFEDAIFHHLLKYGKPYPVWAVVEVLSFGSLPYLLELMREDDLLEVARAFGVKQTSRFTAWVRAVCDLRNVSAHNQRLFNRSMKRDVKVTSASINEELLGHVLETDLFEAPNLTKRVYQPVALLAYFLKSHSVDSNWPLSLSTVVKKLPVVNIASEGGTTTLSAVKHMGFPNGWVDMPLWR